MTLVDLVRVKSIIGGVNDDTFTIDSTNRSNIVGTKLDLNLGDGDDSVIWDTFFLYENNFSPTGEWVGGSGDDTFYVGKSLWWRT